MGMLIRADGKTSPLTPKGKTFAFVGELYPLLVTDMIQVIRMRDGRFMLMDEEAKLRKDRKPLNALATILLRESGGFPDDYILGDVVVCDRSELQSDEDDEVA